MRFVSFAVPRLRVLSYSAFFPWWTDLYLRSEFRFHHNLRLHRLGL